MSWWWIITRSSRRGCAILIEAQEDLSVVGRAADGREALRKVEELQPEVVVMDISMPELNGIEATELIRKRLPHTPVVSLSMYSNQERVWRAFRAGRVAIYISVGI